MIGVFLLGLALLPPLTAGQAIPPHCDAAAFAKPLNVSILGPARSIRVGTLCRPRPPARRRCRRCAFVHEQFTGQFTRAAP